MNKKIKLNTGRDIVVCARFATMSGSLWGRVCRSEALGVLVQVAVFACVFILGALLVPAEYLSWVV